MEEKKFNNAIEKAENLSEDTARVKNEENGATLSDYENELDIRRKREKAQANYRMREAERTAAVEEKVVREKSEKNKKPRYRSINDL